jgi:hypothetical protein
MKDVNKRLGLDRPARYRIKVRGRLDERWSDWFNGMTITSERGITTLTGAVVDQSALHGILAKIRNLNLTLISVTRIESEKDDSHLLEGGERNGKTLENGLA